MVVEMQTPRESKRSIDGDREIERGTSPEMVSSLSYSGLVTRDTSGADGAEVTKIYIFSSFVLFALSKSITETSISPLSSNVRSVIDPVFLNAVSEYLHS